MMWGGGGLGGHEDVALSHGWQGGTAGRSSDRPQVFSVTLNCGSVAVFSSRPFWLALGASRLLSEGL